MLPTLTHRLDLKHVLEAMNPWGRSTNGHKADAVAIRSVAFFTSPPTTLCDFEQKGKAKTFKYLKEHTLETSDDGKFWASAWASGFWNAPPGHGPQTCQQSLAGYNQAMGAGYHLLSFGHMMKSLDNCSRAIMVGRGHVDGQDETRVLFKPTAAERNRGAGVVCLAPVWRFLEYLAGSREVPHLGEARRID